MERKSLTDLVSTLTSRRLRYVLAELASLDHAAVVVEDRYSRILGLTHVRPSVVLDGLDESAAERRFRAWARERRIPVPDRGRLRPEVWIAYRDR
ncbi:MAG: hypothetical protein ABR500_14500 [Dermatophilaceae bacterium]|nr:hypothetical protein [Intrasporangiaceae bacterium]